MLVVIGKSLILGNIKYFLRYPLGKILDIIDISRLKIFSLQAYKLLVEILACIFMGASIYFILILIKYSREIKYGRRDYNKFDIRSLQLNILA